MLQLQDRSESSIVYIVLFIIYNIAAFHFFRVFTCFTVSLFHNLPSHVPGGHAIASSRPANVSVS